MMIWKKESNIQRLQQFIKRLILFTKQCYLIVGSVEKIRKNTEEQKTKITLLSNCAVCCSEKSMFIKDQEASVY